jgi:hypothetical protein
MIIFLFDSNEKFAGPLAEIEGWPTHVMTGLKGGVGGVSYFFPVKGGEAGGAAPFTAWAPNAEAAHKQVNVEAWLNPCGVGGGKYDLMYPNLLDHDSPFGLSAGGESADDDDDTKTDRKTDGLSYGLVGNTSLYVYFVLQRQYIVRVPVAWFRPGQTLPKGPYQPSSAPPPLNPATCSAVTVAGAGSFSGTYTIATKINIDGTHDYKMDVNHSIYHFDKNWIIGKPGRGGHEEYTAPGDVNGQGVGVPKTWGPCTNITVGCVNAI